MRPFGFEAERILRESFGIVAEMAGHYHVVLIATPFHTDEDFITLVRAIRETARYGTALLKTGSLLSGRPIPFRKRP